MEWNVMKWGRVETNVHNGICGRTNEIETETTKKYCQRAVIAAAPKKPTISKKQNVGNTFICFSCNVQRLLLVELYKKRKTLLSFIGSRTYGSEEVPKVPAMHLF